MRVLEGTALFNDVVTFLERVEQGALLEKFEDLSGQIRRIGATFVTHQNAFRLRDGVINGICQFTANGRDGYRPVLEIAASDQAPS
jgi:hypothetical protein